MGGVFRHGKGPISLINLYYKQLAGKESSHGRPKDDSQSCVKEGVFRAPGA